MPTANNILADSFTAHAVNLDRLSASLRQDALKHLKKLEQDLVAQLRAAELGDEPPLTVYKSARLTALLKQTQETIRLNYGAMKDESLQSLQDLAGIETQATVNFLNKSLGASVLSVATNTETLTHIVNRTLIEGSPTREWWSRQAGSTRQLFEDTVRSGLLQGLTTEEIVRKVRGTKKAQFKDGILSASRRNAEALVRSSTMAVANAARIDTLQKHEDILKGMQWVSTLDNRTTHICMSRSGLMYNLDGTPQGHSKVLIGPPAHWNCRSTMTPVVKSWDELASTPAKFKPSISAQDYYFKQQLAKRGFSEKQIAKATRNAQASMDGVVPDVWDYEKWLATKPQAFQKAVLGEGRWGLWKSGKLSFSQLTDNSGNPLTLAELAAEVGGAPDFHTEWTARAFATAPDPMRKLAEDTPVERLPPIPGEGAYYAPGSHSIHMGHIHETTEGRMRDIVYQHELGHAIDFKHGPMKGVPKSYEFRNLMEKDADALWHKTSEYGAAKSWDGHLKTPTALRRAQKNDDARSDYLAKLNDEWWDFDEAGKRAFAQKKLDKFGIQLSDVERGLKLEDGYVDFKESRNMILRFITALERRDAGYFLRDVMDAGYYPDTIGFSLADYFGAITKNRVGWGHAKEYYERGISNQTTEMMANAVVAFSQENPVWGRVLHRMTPNLAKEVEKWLKSLTD